MKTIISLIGAGIATGVGIQGGFWLWDNVLEEKVEGLRDRLSKKDSEKSWP